MQEGLRDWNGLGGGDPARVEGLCGGGDPARVELGSAVCWHLEGTPGLGDLELVPAFQPPPSSDLQAWVGSVSLSALWTPVGRHH